MAEATKMREEQPVASTETSEPSAATTPSATSDDKKESPSTAVDESKAPEIGEALLERLARQVEYYFSSANLSKDTYVSTLRSLNDGYVPVSIIANFGKVKSLVQYDAVNAVRTAATEFSELLEVVEIDTQTGKRVKADESNSSDVSLIEAVGPISGEPIPLSVIPAAPVTPPVIKSTTPVIQNTIIIREVPEGTEESHIRQLFTFENCPAVESLHLDVANCWFVTLNTSSRDDMVNVMFELRKMKFPTGESILARLKSAPVLSAVSTPFVPSMYPPQPASPDRYNNGSRKNKKKKNNSGGAKSRTNGNANNQSKNGKGKNGSPRSRNNAGRQQKKPNGQLRQTSPNQEAPAQQAPPTLGEEHFPTLPTDDMNQNKIELEKVPDPTTEDDSSIDDLGKPKAHSDSASTATTSSSSSSSKQTPQVGGYAAALKKAAPAQPAEPVKKATEKKQTKKETSAKKSPEGEKAKQSKEPKQENTNVDSDDVGVQPPSWGGGRTFADLLRKESMGSSSEQAV